MADFSDFKGAVDIFTTSAFDGLLFSPGVIILFSNSDTGRQTF